MLILSDVPDESGGGEGRAGVETELSSEYQTASELFELMTKNADFHTNDVGSLTTRDLVLLYKNIDIGTKLMNDATENKIKKPNQYVETVVYNDEQESESELSENYSDEDLHNIFMVNQERLDFMDNKSIENLLCHKFGGLEINSSNLSTGYDKKFLFKDPYIKNQLTNLNPMGSSSEFDNIFSTSLLDYICCKRLEDNYNFYMDNIIRYVQHTIEQLKRISNGDYLTDRAKEKWREVNSKDQDNSTKVLATSTSIPMHVQCKSHRNATWDDLVHSEIDVRSLSQILEKKIVVEIPKLICGSYRLYSKRYADNLIISCKKEQQKMDEKGQESRVDVVLKLQRSQTGQVISNISSIMILRSAPALEDLCKKEILSLPCNEETDNINSATYENNLKEPTVAITELDQDIDEDLADFHPDKSLLEVEQDQTLEYQESVIEDTLEEINDCSYNEFDENTDICGKQLYSETRSALKDMLELPVYPVRNEANYNMISPDELRITMRRLSIQKSVLDESGEDVISLNTSKKKSPVRVRIKSPYENKSVLLDEKKRKRLLEIRERREKKKIALSENCKISKHKYAKGAIMPQASSSVTKLSITNKSFYNSIYGESGNVEGKLANHGRPTTTIRKGQKTSTSPTTEVALIEELQGEYFESPMLTPEKNGKKYINRSYYLDDTETEMMYTHLKPNETKDVQHLSSPSNSTLPSEFITNFNILSEFIDPLNTKLNSEPNTSLADEKPPTKILRYEESSVDFHAVKAVPITINTDTHLSIKKSSSSDECRKSIDQLYDLIKQFGKPNPSNLSTSKSKMETHVETCDKLRGNSIIQGSDSGTSLKHQENGTSSNYTGYSSDKNNTITISTSKIQNPPAVVPKVIISSKLQTPRVEVDKTKKDRRRVTVSLPNKGHPDNPLKAISQLLHEFDNVQKTRQKPAPEVKQSKKVEVVPNDVKNCSRQGPYKRRSRLEQHLKDNDVERKITPAYNSHKDKDKRTKPITPLELSRIPHQVPMEDKHLDKLPKKKLADIIDEAKEARGEAVRGPSKLNSRLYNLAQPKKSYVQAHHEEYQNRYGRNLLADRLQRRTTTPSSPQDRHLSSPTVKGRAKRGGGDTTAIVKQPASSASHLDKKPKPKSPRRSASSSPSYQRTVPDPPETIKKMVAVESYVQSHYGPRSPSPPYALGHTCRIPLIPRDLELASTASSLPTEEASELGHTLHRMVDCVLSGASPAHLGALTECEESTSKDEQIPEDVIFCDPHSNSDYNISNLEDENLKTAVETVDKNSAEEDFSDLLSLNPYDLQPLNSTTELEKLEHALYSQMSGAFRKRLRIKTLTLTPKHSMQQVFLVQSGDAGSLILKSTVSNIKLNKCSVESLHDLNATPVLTESHLDWTFTQIPMQIATVGYAFPEYQSSRKVKSSTTKLLEFSEIVKTENAAVHCTSIQKASTSDKISQCFKGHPQNNLSEVGAQVDIVEENSAAIVAVSVGSLNKNLKISEMSENIMLKEIPNDSETVNKVKCADDGDTKTAVVELDNGVQTIESEVCNTTPMPSPDSVDYTTSLDMLVGLLNEIQKITCQNQMAAADNTHNCASLEAIPKRNTAFETTDQKTKLDHDLISISSLDNLRQLDSNASVSSYNLSNDGDATEYVVEHILEDENKAMDRITDLQLLENRDTVDENIMTEFSKPTSVDKEVSVNIIEKEYVNTFTDVTASLMPLVVSAASLTNSAIGVISEPSTQSLFFADYHTPYSNILIKTPSIKKIIELPQVEVDDQRVLVSRHKADLNEKCFKTSITKHITEIVIKENSPVTSTKLNKYCAKNIDLDPMLKMKRDILVTVYSILVFTVFAALSFPQLIMLQ